MAEEIDPITGLPKKKKNAQDIAYGFSIPTQQEIQESLPVVQQVGGFTPDYEAELRNEPGLLGVKSALNESRITDKAARDAAIRSAIATYGDVPSLDFDLPGFSQADLASIIDESTRRTAAQNTEAGLSTKAQLDRIAERNLQSIRRSFAARGGLRSGATRRAIEDETLADRQRRTGALKELSEYLTGAALAFARSQNTREREKAQALIEARDRLLSDPTKQPVAGRKAVEIEPGVFLDLETNTYVDAQGNPITPPASAVASAPAPAADRRGSGGFDLNDPSTWPAPRPVSTATDLIRRRGGAYR